MIDTIVIALAAIALFVGGMMVGGAWVWGAWSAVLAEYEDQIDADALRRRMGAKS